jgi:hypothetical protein
MATARALPRASARVQELAGAEGRARAKGERDRRTRATGRRRALARPETCQGVLTACLARFLACLGTRVPASSVVERRWGVYRRCTGGV